MSTNKKILEITSGLFYGKRIELGLTQEKMAEQLRISRREIQNIEYAAKCPSLETYSNFVNLCESDVLDTLSSISEISMNTKE